MKKDVIDGPLPHQWVELRVVDAGRVQLGRQRSPKHHDGPHMRPYLRVANVFEARIDTESVYEMDFSPSEYETYKLEPGDLLLNEGQSKELVGRAAIYGGEVPGACFTNSLIRFRPKAGISAKWALLTFRHYMHAGVFQRVARWTTNIAHLSSSRLGVLPFRVPPTAEQSRIVAVTDSYLTRLDDAVATLERVQRNLKRYRASILKTAVEGRLVPTEAQLARAEGRNYEPASILLDRILMERRRHWEAAGRKGNYKKPVAPDTTCQAALPEGWCWATIDMLAEVGTGATPLRSEGRYWINGSIPWVTSAVVSHGLVTAPSALVSRTAVAETNLTLYAPGTLLVAMYGEGKTRGKCAELAIQATTNQALAALVTQGEATLVRDWLRVFMTYNYQGLRRQASGGVQPNLNLGMIRSIVVPIPPLPEQVRLRTELDVRLSVVMRTLKDIDTYAKRVARLRQSILKWAFEGKLANQDPNDEPASVLLARIKAEREATATANPKKRTARSAARSGSKRTA